jgi:uncharacterized protein (DUF302 family)
MKPIVSTRRQFLKGTMALAGLTAVLASIVWATAPGKVAEVSSNMNADGIIDLPSKYSAAETIDRLEAVLKSKGIKIFARIDQAAEAKAVGLFLRPTVLLIFGYPRTGTPLMEKYPSLALDLPLKALSWESAEGKVWLSYNGAEYLMQRHHLDTLPFKAVEQLIGKAVQ